MSRRSHARHATQKQIGNHRRHVGIGQRTALLKPGKRPVDHAEQDHRQRLDQIRAITLRRKLLHHIGVTEHDLALLGQHTRPMHALQILDILYQHAMARRRVFVFNHEQFD